MLLISICQRVSLLKSSKDIPVQEKHQFWYPVFIAMACNLHYKQKHLQLWGRQDKQNAVVFSQRRPYKLTGKSNLKKQVTGVLQKSVFVPADVETELYTDLSAYCCLPAGTVCHGKSKTGCTDILSGHTKSPPLNAMILFTENRWNGTVFCWGGISSKH